MYKSEKDSLGRNEVKVFGEMNEYKVLGPKVRKI